MVTRACASCLQWNPYGGPFMVPYQQAQQQQVQPWAPIPELAILPTRLRAHQIVGRTLN